MSAESTDVIVKLPAPVARRGITEPQWRTLANNLYPGAASESVLMVWDYCVARGLDPLKKPCHIVPMMVKDAKTGDYNWRDVVMPGIYEYRTTAHRTGLYMGHSKPVYGPMIEYLGVKAPEWCELIVYKWNAAAGQRGEYPVEILFSEIAATKKNKQTKELELNDRWTKAPRQMLTKCAEAAALREAFPDELGGTHTVEEMEGKVIEGQAEEVRSGSDIRPDYSHIDTDLAQKHVSTIADIIAQDKDENGIADDLYAFMRENVTSDEALACWVHDRVAKDKILTKKQFNDYMALGRANTQTLR